MKNPLRSLPARMVLFVFGAILLTAVAVGFLSLRSTQSFLLENIEQKFPATLATSAVRLDDWYEQRRSEIAIFAERDVLLDNLELLSAAAGGRSLERARSELELYLGYVLEGFPQYTGLFIVDAEGRTRVSVGETVELPGPVRERIARVSGATIGEVLPLAAGDYQIASAPLALRAGERLGSLHALLPVEALDAVLTGGELEESVHILIVGRDGRYVRTSDGRARAERFPGRLPEPGALPEVRAYDDGRGERMVGAARSFPLFGWTIAVEQPYEEAFAPVYSALRSVALINFAIVLAVGLVGFRIAVSIVRPIEALSVAARRISQGERDVEIPETDSSDEVRVLTGAFKQMTARLTSNAAELERSHAAVEEANDRLQRQNRELQRINEVLSQLSITDGLTKLHNHRHFHEALLRACKRSRRSGEPLALVLIDIDYFKRWNDRLGHAGGDEILRRIAEVMMALVRDTDVLTRYGGEEFALIAPGTDLEGASLLAEKIRMTVTREVRPDPGKGAREPLTVSIGIAIFDGDRIKLFNDADRALYAAKESGRDCVVCAEDLPPA